MKKRLLKTVIAALLCIGVFSQGIQSYAQQSDDEKASPQGVSINSFVSYPAGFGCNVSDVLMEYSTSQDIAVQFCGPDGSSIYIYSQDITGFSALEYINYSNKQIKLSRGGFRPDYENNIKLSNGVSAVEFMYSRDIISNIENDKNVYLEINAIYPKDQRVLTFWLKTDSENLEYYRNLLKEMAGSAYVFEKSKQDYKAPYVENEIDIKGEDINLKIGKQSMLWGIMHPHNLNGSDYISNLIPFEEEMGKKFEFLMTYSDFEHNVNLKEVNNVYEDGRVMMLTWQPWVFIDKTQNENIENESAVLIPEIIKGTYDDYIRQWAKDIKSIDEPVFIRFANEMNGDWDSWCAWYFGKDTQLYAQAWKRIEEIFDEEGANNALFVWNPHDRSYPDFDWNNSHMYYPGDEYVDWVGLTGYNNGTSFNGDVWREFGDIYYPIYNEYMKHYAKKPFMITEFSCNEDGGDKAKWISEGFNEFANMPNIKIAVWFNQVDTLWKYNIDSSKESFEAFKASVTKNPHFSMKSVFNAEQIKAERETKKDSQSTSVTRSE